MPRSPNSPVWGEKPAVMPSRAGQVLDPGQLWSPAVERPVTCVGRFAVPSRAKDPKYVRITNSCAFVLSVDATLPGGNRQRVLGCAAATPARISLENKCVQSIALDRSGNDRAASPLAPDRHREVGVRPGGDAHLLRDSCFVVMSRRPVPSQKFSSSISRLSLDGTCTAGTKPTFLRPAC